MDNRTHLIICGICYLTSGIMLGMNAILLAIVFYIPGIYSFIQIKKALREEGVLDED